jgi:hypothetical protein
VGDGRKEKKQKALDEPMAGQMTTGSSDGMDFSLRRMIT